MWVFRATKDFHVPGRRHGRYGWIVINLSARQRALRRMRDASKYMPADRQPDRLSGIGPGVSCSSGQNKQIPRITCLFVFVKQSRPLLMPGHTTSLLPSPRVVLMIDGSGRCACCLLLGAVARHFTSTLATGAIRRTIPKGAREWATELRLCI